MSAIVYSPVSYSRLRSAATEAMQAARLPLWLCAAQAMVAYEWLVSGVNKLLNPWLSAHLPAMLQQGNPNGWYVTFLRGVVMPRSVQSGAVVTWSEMAVGIVLLLSALLWATWPENRLTPLLTRAACLALVAAVAMNVTYNLVAGKGLPWIDPSHVYEGVRLDAVLSLAGLALLRANLSALRKLSRL